jgi:hypothetical protein
MLSLTSTYAIRKLTPRMRPLTRAHGFVAASLLIIAITAVLGHICVLPVHAHAVPVEGHGSHDDDSSENSVHTASCDALKSASATPTILPVAMSTPLVVVEPLSLKRRAFDAAPGRADADSPPLFLLHAALLI